MTGKQKLLLICFNVFALVGIVWSGGLLFREIWVLLGDVQGFGYTALWGNIISWSVHFDVDGDWERTVYNYLFIVSGFTVFVNIVLVGCFSIWNKRV